VRKWCPLFNGGRTVVHNEARSGRPPVITNDLKERVDTLVTTDDSLLMSSMKFSHMFRDLSSMRLSQLTPI
jgi:hypothetical protein